MENSVTYQQGTSTLEDALNRCYLRCINDGNITRAAIRQGDLDSVIYLEVSILRIAKYNKFQKYGAHGNYRFPMLFLVSEDMSSIRELEEKNNFSILVQQQ